MSGFTTRLLSRLRVAFRSKPGGGLAEICRFAERAENGGSAEQALAGYAATERACDWTPVGVTEAKLIGEELPKMKVEIPPFPRSPLDQPHRGMNHPR